WCIAVSRVTYFPGFKVESTNIPGNRRYCRIFTTRHSSNPRQQCIDFVAGKFGVIGIPCHWQHIPHCLASCRRLFIQQLDSTREPAVLQRDSHGSSHDVYSFPETSLLLYSCEDFRPDGQSLINLLFSHHQRWDHPYDIHMCATREQQ